MHHGQMGYKAHLMPGLQAAQTVIAALCGKDTFMSMRFMSVNVKRHLAHVISS